LAKARPFGSFFPFRNDSADGLLVLKWFMKRRRVKITGIGPVTPAGIGRDAFWKGITEPVSRVSPYQNLGAEFGPFVAAHIPNFDIGLYVADKSVLPKNSARHTLFAVAGAMLAVEDAGIRMEELRGENCVIVTGSSLMDFGGISSSTEAVIHYEPYERPRCD
jgi:3-oxoacyl-(acyl-carrier-protein) synthase